MTGCLLPTAVLTSDTICLKFGQSNQFLVAKSEPIQLILAPVSRSPTSLYRKNDIEAYKRPSDWPLTIADTNN